MIFLTKVSSASACSPNGNVKSVPSVLIGDDITFDSGSEGKFYLEKVDCCIDISD